MIIKVKVHPNSKQEKVVNNGDKIFDIYVNQKPIEGEVNKRLVITIAKYFKTKNNKVFLITGEKSREKSFEVKDN